MFSNSYLLAKNYTHPVIISYRFYNGTVKSGLGAFVIINNEGWIITAAHMLNPTFLYNQHKLEIEKYKNNLLTKIKNLDLKHLFPQNKWITNYSFWWSNDIFRINNFIVLIENDLAIGKIENYTPNYQNAYPIFKNPNNLKYGTNLCKIGYPFYEVKTKFNSETKNFEIDPNIFPIPIFPIDGILTRTILAGKSKDNRYDIKYIETSTPGLKGQSGGPIFDINGHIWGIQSKTQHLSLGFSPKVKKGKKEIEENQFLNIGWGAHVDTIIKFLTANNVRHSVSD